MADELLPSEEIATGEISAENGAPAQGFGADLADDHSIQTAITDLPTLGEQGAFVEPEAAGMRTSIFVMEGENEARDLVGAVQRELDATSADPSKARLHHQLALLFESRLFDGNGALFHHRAAHELQPNNLSYLRALRRFCASRQSWTMVVELLDKELELRSDPIVMARLLAEKGEILEEWLANQQQARVAYQRALERDPANRLALHRLRSLALASGGDLQELCKLCRQSINATTDRRLRAQLYGQLAELELQLHDDPERAMESFAVAFVEDPANDRARESLKLLYEQCGRWGDLIDVLLTEGDLADSDKQRAMLYLRAARICRDKLGQTERAIELLDRVKDVDTDRLVLRELSELLAEAGRFEQLITTRELQIRLATQQDERAALQLSLGDLMEFRAGRIDEAITHYCAALDSETTRAEAVTALERTYRLRGRYRELAELQLESLNQLEDPAHQAAMATAVGELCERELNDTARAIVCFKRALAAVDGYDSARRELIRLYRQTGAFSEALPLMQQAAAVADDEQAVAMLLEAGALVEQHIGDLEQASGFYLQVLERRPQHLAAIQALQRTCGALQDDEGQIRYLDMEVALSSDTQTVSLRRRAASLCEALGKMELAEQRYRDLVQDDPIDPISNKALRQLLARKEAWGALAELLQVQIGHAEGRERANLYHQLGDLWESRLGKPERAIECYRKAIEGDPRCQGALHSLTRLYRVSEQWEPMIEALEALANAAESPQRQANIQLTIGETYELRLQDKAKAIERYRLALELSNEQHAARSALLRLLAGEGRNADAIEVLESSVSKQLEPHLQLQLLKQLARLRIAEGLTAGAVQALQEALSLDARDGEVLLELAGLYRETAQYPALVTCLQRLADVTEDTSDRVRLLFEAATCAEAYLPLERDPAPYYRSVLDIAPHDQRAVAALVRIHRERDELTELVATLELQRGLTDQATEQVGLLMELSAAFEGRGDLDRAERALADAADLGEDWLVLRELRRVRERSGRWPDVALTLEREAAACWDDAEAAQSLMAASTLYLDRLDQVSSGIRVLRSVLERMPFHEEAASKLEQVLVQRGDWRQLVEVAEARLQAARQGAKPPGGTPQHAQIELLVRIAWILREHLGEAAGAVAALKRALEIDPHHISTLLTLADLHATLEQWHEATEAYAKLVVLSDDPDLLLRAHTQLGEIWRKHLKDIRRAISCYQNVLAVEPKQRVALRRLAQLFRSEGEWDSAAYVVSRLLEVEREPDAQVVHHLSLAEISEQGLREYDSAVQHYQQALSIDPANTKVVERMAELLTRLGDWERLVESLRLHLASLPEARQAHSIPRRMQLADVLYRHLQRSAEALEQYRAVVEIDPTDTVSRLKTARLLAEQGRVDEAISLHRELLELDPVFADSLSDLRTIYSRMGDKEMSYACAAVLVCVGSASEADQRVYREHRAGGVRYPQGPLDPAAFTSVVVHPTEQHGGRAVLNVLCEVAHRLRSPGLDEWQVGKGDRLATRGDDPLRNIVRHVGTTLGLDRDVDVYISDLRPTEMGLLLTDPPALVVGNGVMAGRSSRLVRFGVAVLLTYIRNRNWLAYGLDGDELQRWVLAACRLVDPGVAIPESMSLGEVDYAGNVIQRGLGRRGRRALEDAVQAFQDTRAPTFDEWGHGIEASSLRTALWVVNDLETGLEHLRLVDSSLAAVKTPARLAEAYRERRVVRELIAYWLSDDYAAAKQAANL